MSSRITSNMVQEWIENWNKYRPEFKMGTTFSLNYAAIGFLSETGGLDVIVRGETPREAWEKFTEWKSGFIYCESLVREGKTDKLDL